MIEVVALYRDAVNENSGYLKRIKHIQFDMKTNPPPDTLL